MEGAFCAASPKTSQKKMSKGWTHASGSGRGWDGSDQQLWHGLYARVHELPFAYNANADANMTLEEWGKVYLLHDIVVQRKRGWGRSGYAGLVRDLTAQARSALQGLHIR